MGFGGGGLKQGADTYACVCIHTCVCMYTCVFRVMGVLEGQVDEGVFI